MLRTEDAEEKCEESMADIFERSVETRVPLGMPGPALAPDKATGSNSRVLAALSLARKACHARSKMRVTRIRTILPYAHVPVDIVGARIRS